MRHRIVANGKSTAPRPRGPVSVSLEHAIVGMAARGELARPARQAVRRQRRKGFPITVQRGLEIVKRHADGSEEVLGTATSVAYAVPKGVRVIASNGHGKR